MNAIRYNVYFTVIMIFKENAVLAISYIYIFIYILFIYLFIQYIYIYRYIVYIYTVYIYTQPTMNQTTTFYITVEMKETKTLNNKRYRM